MKIWIKSWKANLYKMIFSKLLLVHIGISAFAVLVAVAYYCFSPWSEVAEVKAYFSTLAIAFPLMIAITTTIVYEMDLKAGRFQLLLSVPGNKFSSHFGNYCALLTLGIIAVIVASFGFGLLFAWSKGNKLPQEIVQFGWKGYCVSAGLLLFVNIANYILQYMICYSFGKGVSLGIGALATLISPLMYLGIGDSIWKMLPCSYGIRMISYQFLKWIGNPEGFELVRSDYTKGFVVITVVTIGLVGLFVIWSQWYQGNKEIAE